LDHAQIRAVALRAIPSLESEWGSQTPERAGSTSTLAPLMHASTGPSRSVPEYACPFTERTKRIQKRPRPQPSHERLRLHANTGLAGTHLVFKFFLNSSRFR